MKRNRLLGKLLICAQAVAISSVASAYEFDAQVRAGLGVSDNIARTSQDEVDETIAAVGFDFGVVQNTRTLDLNIRSNFDYIDYLDGTFDSELVGGLNGTALFTLIDERVTWIFQDTFGQSIFNPLQPARPDNRENVNYFTTGPSLSLLAAARNPIILDLRYSKINYEIRPNDNDRLSATLSAGRDISRASTVSINLDAQRVEFDNGITPPIDRREAYVRFETTGNASVLGIDIGYNEFEFDGRTGDGLLARFDFTHNTSANGRFRASGGSQFSEQGDIFRFYREITGNLTDTADITDSPAPFQNNFFTIAYSLDHERSSVSVSVDWNQEDYKDGQGIDRDVFRANAVFRRNITRAIFAGANVGFNRREFKYQDNRRDDDLILGLDVGYRISSGFDVSLEYQHFQRSSASLGADYTENRAFVRLAYTPVWSR